MLHIADSKVVIVNRVLKVDVVVVKRAYRNYKAAGMRNVSF